MLCFVHFDLGTASRHNSVHFFDMSTSKSAPGMLCFVHFDLGTASCHNSVHFFDMSTSKSAPGMVCFVRLTWKCASRHKGVHFFDMSTSKSAPRPSVFNTFDLEICSAHPRFNFTYGVGTSHFVGIKFIHNISLYKMVFLNLQSVVEHDNMILLQNEDGFLSSGYLTGKFNHYKMTIGCHHQVTK